MWSKRRNKDGILDTVSETCVILTLQFTAMEHEGVDNYVKNLFFNILKISKISSDTKNRW